MHVLVAVDHDGLNDEASHYFRSYCIHEDSPSARRLRSVVFTASCHPKRWWFNPTLAGVGYSLSEQVEEQSDDEKHASDDSE
jgi:hypothetical protein